MYSIVGGRLHEPHQQRTGQIRVPPYLHVDPHLCIGVEVIDMPSPRRRIKGDDLPIPAVPKIVVRKVLFERLG